MLIKQTVHSLWSHLTIMQTKSILSKISEFQAQKISNLTQKALKKIYALKIKLNRTPTLTSYTNGGIDTAEIAICQIA